MKTALTRSHTLRITLLCLCLLGLYITPVLSQSRIIGGQDADILDYPWQVAIVANGTNTFDGQFCGGTIIDPFWIVSATHCMEGEELGSFRIIAGISNLSTDAGQEREVAQIINHPNYNEATFDSDITLIRLAKPLDLSDPRVSAIPYATAADVAAGLIDPGIISTITGWGSLDSLQQSFPTTLQVAQVPIVSNDSVRPQYEIRNNPITSNMLAAGLLNVGGIDACGGDSGGPLVVPNADNSSVILAGITSFGIGCADPLFPGIYTRVSEFESWIQQNSGVGLAPPVRKDLDMAILSMELPGVSTQAICDGDTQTSEISIRAVITNEGKIPIGSVIVQIVQGPSPDSLEAITVDTLAFETPLLTGCSFILNERFVETQLTGDFFFGLALSEPNLAPDQALENNVELQALNISEGAALTMMLRTDAAPQESFWVIEEISNPASPVLTYAGNGLQPYPAPDSLFMESVCLPAGNYRLVFRDLAANGFQEGGTFQVTIDAEGEEYEILRSTDDFVFGSTVNFSIPFVPNFDASITIESPTDNSQNATCEPFVSGNLLISNEGSLPLTAAALSVQVANSGLVGEVDVYIPSGSLISISFDSLLAQLGANTLIASIQSVNGGETETEITNNQDTVTFDLSITENAVNARFVLQTDEFPEETAWEIRDESGEVVLSQETIREINADILTELCQSEGCYQLAIFDSFSDGIFVDTSATIILEDGVQLFDLTGDFTDSIVQDFCLLQAPTELAATSSNDNAVLDWVDNSAIESGFLIERRVVDVDSFIVIGQVAADITTFTDTSPSVDSLYIYRVRAVKDSSVSAQSNEVQLTTSLELELAGGRFLLFPNPASAQLHIEWDQGAILGSLTPTLRVIDLQGRTHLQQRLSSSHRHIIPTSGLSNGMYLLQIQSARGTIQRKLVIHHQ